MPRSLFIRSYPAPGVQVIPASYSAGTNGYFVVCLLPVAAACWFAIALYNSVSKPQWLFEGLFASIMVLLLGLSYLRSLKLEITIDGISFAILFHGTHFISFGEISTVVFLDYRHLRSEAIPRRTLRSWQAVITPNGETGKSKIRIPLNMFPPEACSALTRLLKPEVWESDG